VHAPSEEKSDDSKDRFYEELEQAFNHFPKYHIETTLGDFNATGGEGLGIFSNLQLGMRVYNRIVIIMVLE
jgi:hypothetical protein